MLAKIYFKEFVFDISVIIFPLAEIGFFYSYVSVARAKFGSIKLNVISQVEILTTLN